MSYKYSDKERIQWLESLNPNFKTQTWHNNVVYHPSHIQHLLFFKKDNSVIEKIDPAKICGIEYAYAYNCPTHKKDNWRYHWSELLTDLKRLDWVIDNFDSREKVVNHINNNKENKVVLQYGKQYFTISGQHRLGLAKFLDLPEVEVIVEKHVMDRELFTREMRFKKCVPDLINQKFLPLNYEIEHEYDFIFLHIGKDSIFVKKKYASFVLKRYSKLKTKPYKSIVNLFKTFLIKHNKRIDDDNKLYSLDIFLIKHILKFNKK